MLPHWIKKKNSFHFVKTKMRGYIIKQDLSLGFPSLIAQLTSGIVMIIFNTIILKLEGNTGVAAYQYFLTIRELILIIPMTYFMSSL